MDKLSIRINRIARKLGVTVSSDWDLMGEPEEKSEDEGTGIQAEGKGKGEENKGKGEGEK